MRPAAGPALLSRHPPRSDLPTLPLHAALPISPGPRRPGRCPSGAGFPPVPVAPPGHRRESCPRRTRSEEHTSELQSRGHLVCRLLLEKKNVLPPSLSIVNNCRSNGSLLTGVLS